MLHFHNPTRASWNRMNQIYEAVTKESHEHTITDDYLKDILASAEKSKNHLYPQVKNLIEAEKAKKQRLQDEENKRIDEENKRIADEQQRRIAAEEAKKNAEEKQLADTKSRKEAVAHYGSVPQSARNALNMLKKVEARIEIGVNYSDYSRIVGEAWGEVKIFIDSPEGKELYDFSNLLRKSISDYKSALKVWQYKIEFSTLAKYHKFELEELQQKCWSRACTRIYMAEQLLVPEKAEKALEEISLKTGKDEDFDAAVDRILLEK